MYSVKIKSPSKKKTIVIKRVDEKLMITEGKKEEQKAKSKNKTPAKKVIYTSKHGGKAIFDSINLVALIFGVDSSSVRNLIGRKRTRLHNGDWLKGGTIDFYNE